MYAEVFCVLRTPTLYLFQIQFCHSFLPRVPIKAAHRILSKAEGSSSLHVNGDSCRCILGRFEDYHFIYQSTIDNPCPSLGGIKGAL